MTEQNQNPAGTDDVQGHFRRSEPDRMEGWGAETPGDDVEGHFRRGEAPDTEGTRNTRARGMADGGDDTQGHGGRGYPGEAGDAEGTDDDTEGHARR